MPYKTPTVKELSTAQFVAAQREIQTVQRECWSPETLQVVQAVVDWAIEMRTPGPARVVSDAL